MEPVFFTSILGGWLLRGSYWLDLVREPSLLSVCMVFTWRSPFSALVVDEVSHVGTIVLASPRVLVPQVLYFDICTRHKFCCVNVNIQCVAKWLAQVQCIGADAVQNL